MVHFAFGSVFLFRFFYFICIVSWVVLRFVTVGNCYIACPPSICASSFRWRRCSSYCTFTCLRGVSWWSSWLWPLSCCPHSAAVIFGTVVGGQKKRGGVTLRWLVEGERVQPWSTDRCTDPVHPCRCHLHFIGHLEAASTFFFFFFNSHLDAIKASLLSSGCPEDFPAAPMRPLAS